MNTKLKESFKRGLSSICCAAMLLQIMPTVSLAADNEETPWGASRTEVTLEQTERVTTYNVKDLKTGDVYGLQNHGESRKIVSLNDLEWKFICGNGDNNILGEEAAATDYEDTSWTGVTLPHTWNAEDTQDGERNTMNKTVGWYRGTLNVDSIAEGSRYYLEFMGANQTTDVYINGEHALLALDVADYSQNSNILSVDTESDYTHLGGYTTFRYDITSYLQQGDNLIAIKLDNRIDPRIIPQSADFNFYGGIYRDLNLVIVSDVHVAMDDYGSSGLYVATPNAGKMSTSVTTKPTDLGKLAVTAEIANDSNGEKTVVVDVTVSDQDGTQVASIAGQSLKVPANSSTVYSQSVTVTDPILWEGIDYSEDADNSHAGYQYTVKLSVKQDGKEIDSVQEKVGFRWFYVDRETGFYLNGKSYPLRGVNRHQDRPGKGFAISMEDHLEDFKMIMEMGANTIRLAHYPHDNYFYDLCDANGIVVWAEIPFVDKFGSDEKFDEVTKSMLIELIRQQYNRPSICFWGLQNEVGNGGNTSNSHINMVTMSKQLDNLAKAEDPTRYTTQATNQAASSTGPWASDLVSCNIYPGWYGAGNYEGSYSGHYNRETSNKLKRPFGISEYGAGAGVNETIHELNPANGSVGANKYWQPEEYQTQRHEEALKMLLVSETGKKVWASHVWNMFDFGVDHRAQEAGEWEKNNKGLVSFDRQTRKDAFYLYKANLNDQDAFAYISSRRYTTRTEAPSYVKVFSNCDEVWLSVAKDGGTPEIIKMEKDDSGLNIFMVYNQMKEAGEYTVKVYGIRDGDSTHVYTDTVSWTKRASNSTDLTSSSADVLPDNEKKQIALRKEMTLKALRAVLSGSENATYEAFDGENKVEETDVVRAGMTIVVTAEDGTTTATYSVVPPSLSAYATVSASTTQSGNTAQNAVDGNSTTRWAASSTTMPQTYTLDLKDIYRLSSITIDWYGDATRKWTYNIYSSVDGTNWVKRASQNAVAAGSVTNALGQYEGRYVKIEVTNCSDNYGQASFYEVNVYGWKLDMAEDSGFTVDNDRYQIVCDKPVTEMEMDALQNAIIAEGNCSAKLNSVGPVYLGSTDTVTVTDHMGNEIIYSIVSEDDIKETPYNLALYKPVAYSSEEGVADNTGESTVAYNVNDGSTLTRWAAGKTNGKVTYPQWIAVDLGAVYDLSEVELYFFKYDTANRNYKCKIWASNDTAPVTGKTQGYTDGYTLLVDKSTHTDRSGHYKEMLTGAKGRYVLVEVTGTDGGEWAAASIYEIRVYGLAQVQTVTASPEAGSYDKGLKVTLSTDTEDAEIYYTTDNSVPTVDSQKYTDPITVDETMTIKAIAVKEGMQNSAVASFRYVLPGPISENKTVYYSSEEGISENNSGDETWAKHVNDGDISTRWAAAKTDGKVTYPQWIAIDLGAVYNLTEAELYFFKYNAGGRLYKYKIWVSNDTASVSGKTQGYTDGYTLLVDKSDSTDTNGHYTHDLSSVENATGRYILLEVTESDGSEWAAASIHEFKVDGTLADQPQPAEITGTVTIDGDAKYGETLTAVVSANAPQNGLTYTWTCDDRTATGETYTITADDIGKAITLTVTAEGYTGSMTCVTDEVTKAQNTDKLSGVTATNCTAEGSSDGKLNGITTKMEYSADNGTTWTRGTDDDITDLAAGDYLVRYAETETYEASEPITVVIGVDGGDTSDDPKKEETPNASFDAATMTLSGLKAGMKYSVDGGVTWETAKDSTADLSELSVNAKDGILVYKPGDGENTSDSDKQVIELTQADEPAGLSVGEDGKVIGLDPDKSYEYKVGVNDDWKTLDADTVLEEGIYQIRISGEGLVLASKSVVVTYGQSGSVNVTGVKLNMNSAKLYINHGADTLQLIAAVEPEDAENKNVVWTSNDESVATVDQNGLVTIHSIGTVTITATTEDGGHMDLCLVNVKKYKSSSGSSSSSSTSDTNKVTVEDADNGSVKTDVSKAEKGDTVTITVKPDAGYEVDEVIVTDKNGDEIKVKDQGDGEFTFKMPDSKVEIEVAFKPVSVPTPPVFISYSDVTNSDWFASAVSYVSANGIMNGNRDSFSPNTDLNRGMIAQILYNMEGGVGSFALAYPDVSSSDWYANAVSWVSAHGVMSGYGSGLFGANDSVTREQLALTLYQYARVKGYDLSGSVELTAFVDGHLTSDWARPAMQWAVANGLISGKSGSKLDPQGTATRAEVAAVLMNFAENIAK